MSAIIKKFKTLSEFVDFVLDNMWQDEWIFRGQKNAKWPLIPSIARIRPRINSTLETEKDIFSEFKRWAPPHLSIIPKNSWEWLTLAQHYRLPTRLLDWTTNPLAAMYFAICEPSKLSSAVWCYKYPTKLMDFKKSPFKISRIMVFNPRHIISRVVSQSACFTIHPYPFRNMQNAKLGNNRLYKLVISSKAKAEMRMDLDKLGIHCASLFPDLEGVCNYINWANTLLEDEAEA